MPSCSKLALDSTSLSRTLTHLEQAIANVVSSKEPLDYSHVLSAYSRIYHSVNTEPYFATEAALRFEITLGKYVEPKEKVGSPFHAFAKCIVDIRTELMEHKVALSAKLFEGQSLPCPCCGDVLSEEIIRLKLGLLDGAPSPGKLLFPRSISISKVNWPRDVSNSTSCKKRDQWQKAKFASPVEEFSFQEGFWTIPRL